MSICGLCEGSHEFAEDLREVLTPLFSSLTARNQTQNPNSLSLELGSESGDRTGLVESRPVSHIKGGPCPMHNHSGQASQVDLDLCSCPPHLSEETSNTTPWLCAVESVPF
jgi:hypothetical protein